MSFLISHRTENLENDLLHPKVEPKSPQKKRNIEQNTQKHDEILLTHTANESKKHSQLWATDFIAIFSSLKEREPQKRIFFHPFLNQEKLAAQRWRKLPADFVNATQFYQNLKPRNSRRIPEPKAGQLNAGLACFWVKRFSPKRPESIFSNSLAIFLCLNFTLEYKTRKSKN